MKKQYYNPNSKVVSLQWEGIICAVSDPTQNPIVNESQGTNAAPRKTV